MAGGADALDGRDGDALLLGEGQTLDGIAAPTLEEPEMGYNNSWR